MKHWFFTLKTHLALGVTATSWYLLGIAYVIANLSCVAAEEDNKQDQVRVAEGAKLKETLTFITREYLKASPEPATSLAISPEEAGGKYSDRLSDQSEADEVREIATMKDWLARLEKLNPSAPGESDRISLDLVKTALSNGLGTADSNGGKHGLGAMPYRGKSDSRGIYRHPGFPRFVASASLT